MKKLFSGLLLFLSLSVLTAQETDESNSQTPDIILPPITTVIEEEKSEVEQKKVYTAKEIEQYHSESLTDFLQSVGIQILSYGNYGLEQKPSIRGFTDETVRVIIDGVCMNNAQYGTFDFSIININDIEKIEVVKGGFTEGVSDEGAVGGAIYITTKKYSFERQLYSDTFFKTFFASSQPLDTICQSLGFITPVGKNQNTFIKESLKGEYAANKYLYTQKLNSKKPNVRYFDFAPDDSTRVEREHSEVFDLQNSLKATHFFGNGNSFSISDIFYYGNKNVPNVEFSTDNGIQKDLNNALSITLFNPSLFDYLKMQHTLSWIYDNRNYTAPSEHSIHDINTARYAGFIDLYKYDNYSQTASLTLDFTHLNSTNDGTHNQFTGTFKETSQLQLGEHFGLSLPLALKFCNKNFAFIPKAGVRFKTKYIDLLLDGYRMVQFPTMDDLYWDAENFHGNPDLKPEDGWGGDFTINAHDIWLPFSICVYTNYYKNKIQWSGTTPKNVASAFYLGADIEFDKHFFDDKLQIRGNVEYLYTKLLDKTNKFTYGKKIMWTPDLTASLYVLAAINNPIISTISIDGSYTGKRYKTNMNLAHLDPYFLLNASIQFQNIKKLSLYLRAENLLNTSYQSVENYPMPGTSLTLGGKFIIL